MEEAGLPKTIRWSSRPLEAEGLGGPGTGLAGREDTEPTASRPALFLEVSFPRNPGKRRREGPWGHTRTQSGQAWHRCPGATLGAQGTGWLGGSESPTPSGMAVRGRRGPRELHPVGPGRQAPSEPPMKRPPGAGA